MHPESPRRACSALRGAAKSVATRAPHAIALLIVACAVTAVHGADAAPASARYLDVRRPLAARVADLVRRLTLEEEASQMVNHARAIPRLGVPDYDWWSEALHGVLSPTGAVTVFPEPIGLAATFDPELIRKLGEIIALEGRARYELARRAGRTGLFEGLTFFSPNINIFRDPRWGRGQETYGEDPWLTSRMGIAFIRGLQGDDRDHPRVVATAKHFAVHSGPEPLRHGFDARVSRHDLEDTYLPAFRAAVLEGRVASIMCAYNAVNGVPACANGSLLGDRLRHDWKFAGYVVSDCDAITDIYAQHHFASAPAQARALAVRAGLDNECLPVFSDSASEAAAPPAPEYQVYVDAVRQGLLRKQDLDAAVARSLRWRFALGMFDPPRPMLRAPAPEDRIDIPAHRALALESAQRSIVLLKNNGLLPLPSTIHSIAVVGPLADQRNVLLGNYHGTPARSTTVLEGVRRAFPTAQVAYERSADLPGDPAPVPAAWLSTDEGQPGLRAEYFAGPAVSGVPFLVRVEASAGTNPALRVPTPPGATAHSIRWSGWLTPPESGNWQLGLRGLLASLSLDGKMIVDMRAPSAPMVKSARVALLAGHRYAIALECAPVFASIELVASLELSAEIQAQRAAAAVTHADAVVAVVGITSQLEGEEAPIDIPGFKGGDRTTLELPAMEQSMLEALKATGRPLVVVLMNGSALAVNWAQQNADAILEAWYPGEEGGNAVADTLVGASNPAGRLPVTFYKDIGQLPPFEDYSMAQRTYRYFGGEPLYPFGFGLSYSTFAYGGLALSAPTLKAGKPLMVQVRVTNTSRRDGDEAVQLYLEFPKWPGAPRRALRAFERVHLRAGESRRVTLQLAPRELSYVDAIGEHRIDPGQYTISVGGGQPGDGTVTVSAPLMIVGQKRLAR